MPLKSLIKIEFVYPIANGNRFDNSVLKWSMQFIRKREWKKNANLLTLNSFRATRHASVYIVYFVFCLFDFRDYFTYIFSSLTYSVEFSVRDFPLCPKHFLYDLEFLEGKNILVVIFSLYNLIYRKIVNDRNFIQNYFPYTSNHCIGRFMWLKTIYWN